MNFSTRFYTYTLWSLPNFLWPLKKLIILCSLKKHGKSTKIGPNVIISHPNLLSVGDYVFIGDHTTITGTIPISIGNFVMLGPEVMIRGGDHNFLKVGVPMRFVKEGGINIPIVIEDDVWIGTRVIILKGVTICEGSVIGAGSIVTKSMPPYSICVGTPCRPIKCRFSHDDLKTHLKSLNSKYSVDEVKIAYNKWNLLIE